MKYTKITKKLGGIVRSIFWGFVILVLLGLSGLFVWCDFSMANPLVSFVLLVWIPGLCYSVNYCISLIAGDELTNTGMVSDGHSVFDIKRTPKYYSRRMISHFVGCILFVLLLLRYMFYLGYLCIMSAYYLVFFFVGAVGSVIGVVVCFIFGMSAYEKSSLKQRKDNVDNTEIK